MGPRWSDVMHEACSKSTFKTWNVGPNAAERARAWPGFGLL